MYKAIFKGNYVELHPIRRYLNRWHGLEAEEIRAVENGAVIYPYPCRIVEQAPVYVCRRLESTRAGNNARWEASERGHQCLNSAPYEPMFRGWVKKFWWTPPNDQMSERDGTCSLHDGDIIQLGSGVLNWGGYVIEPSPPDEIRDDWPDRGHFRLLLKECVEHGTFEHPGNWEQGSLRIYQLPPHLEEAVKESVFYPYSRVVYNHFFPGGGVIARYREWFLVQAHELIIAHDHPVLYLDGLYVAYHPLPTRTHTD